MGVNEAMVGRLMVVNGNISWELELELGLRGGWEDSWRRLFTNWTKMVSRITKQASIPEQMYDKHVKFAVFLH